MKSIGNLESTLEENGIAFLTYGGFLTQTLLVALTEALEQGIESCELSRKTSINIFTIFIELSQNIMNYSKGKKENSGDFDPKGMIIVGKSKDEEYYVLSQNVISIADRGKIEPKLIEIAASDRDTLKKRYREARRSGKDAHSKGGGIGFYEVAKRCASVEYEFEDISDDKLYFRFKAILEKES